MKLTADINICKIKDWQSNAGEVNARTLEVEMCENLCSCAQQFVVFTLADGTKLLSKVENGKAAIPQFNKAQYITIGLYGSNIENDECVLRYSPQPAKVFVNKGSYTNADGTETSFENTTIEELLAEIKAAEKVENKSTDLEADRENKNKYPNVADILKYIDDNDIKPVESVNLSTCESGVYFTNKIIYKKAIMPQPFEEMVPNKAFLVVEKNAFGIYFYWLSPYSIIEGLSNAAGKFEDDFTKHTLADINNAIKKTDIETEVAFDLDENHIYNVGAINNAFMVFYETLTSLDERLSAIENNPPSSGLSYGIMKPTAEDASIEATTTASIEKTE